MPMSLEVQGSRCVKYTSSRASLGYVQRTAEVARALGPGSDVSQLARLAASAATASCVPDLARASQSFILLCNTCFVQYLSVHRCRSAMLFRARGH